MTTQPVQAGAQPVVQQIRAERRRHHGRTFVVLTGLSALAIGALLACIAYAGSVSLALGDVVAALTGGGDELTRFVVLDKRLPRALVALLVGALFGLSGALYQRLVGNVLATPDIIGVSAGAGTGAVAVLVIGGTGLAVQSGAVLGATGAAALIFLLSRRNGSNTYRLVLVGIGIGACCASVTSYLLTFTDEMTSSRAMRWLIGSLSTADWPDVLPLLVTTAVGFTASVLLSPALRTLQLGDRLAAGLGVRVDPVRVTLLLLGAVLAAIATSVVGPIAFVALVAAPIAGRLLPGYGLLPAAVVGSVIVAVSDLVAAAAPVISPIPTGVVTGLVGAPVLLRLLLSRRPSR